MSKSATPTYDELATLVVQQQGVLAEQATALELADVRITQLEAEILRLKNGGSGGKGDPDLKPDWLKLNKPQVVGSPTPRKPRAQGFTPTPDLTEVVVGGQTFGHGVSSLVAYLDTVGRLPVRIISRLFSCLLKLSISDGQIVSLLHTVAKAGQATYSDLKRKLRASDFVHADETGWRENGLNGYVWSFSTPLLRYFVYAKSRAHTVPKEVLGEGYIGTWQARGEDALVACRQMLIGSQRTSEPQAA